MNNYKFIFQVKSDEQPSKTFYSNDYKTQGEKLRITLKGDGDDVCYSFTFINEGKVSLACKGYVSYSFTLEEGKRSNFLITALGGEIPCEVFCTKLSLTKTQKGVTANGKYIINVGGNESNTQFILRGEL